MRYIFLALALAALAAHALFFSPLLFEASVVGADISFAVWILCLFAVAIAAICIEPVAAPVESGENDPAHIEARIRAALEANYLAASPDFSDAFTYGMCAHRMGISREGLVEMLAIPIADLIKHAEAHRAVDDLATADPVQSSATMRIRMHRGGIADVRMRIRMHRGGIDEARKTEEVIPATMEAVRSYLVRHDWPEALVGQLEVVEYSQMPAHGWEEHFIILLNKIPVGFTSAPVDIVAPVTLGVDLAKPSAERTIIIKGRRNGITATMKAHAARAAVKRAKREERNLRASMIGAAA